MLTSWEVASSRRPGYSRVQVKPPSTMPWCRAAMVPNFEPVSVTPVGAPLVVVLDAGSLSVVDEQAAPPLTSLRLRR